MFLPVFILSILAILWHLALIVYLSMRFENIENFTNQPLISRI